MYLSVSMTRRGNVVRYAIYTRTKEGITERVSFAIAIYPKDAETAYIHKESLSGFPESVVFWDNSTGASVGIAPIESPPISPDPQAD
jgi:hypothetical protein